MGVANYGKYDNYDNPLWKHTTASEFDVASVTRPRVDIIYAYLEMRPPQMVLRRYLAS